MVDAPAAVMARDPLPGPTRFRRVARAQDAVCVLVAEVLQSRNDTEFGRVPLRTSVRTQASLRVAREGDHLAAGQLSPGVLRSLHSMRGTGSATVRP